MNVIFFTLSGNSQISYLYMLLLFDASLFPCKLFTKWLVILKLSKLGKKNQINYRYYDNISVSFLHIENQQIPGT